MKVPLLDFDQSHDQLLPFALFGSYIAGIVGLLGLVAWTMPHPTRGRESEGHAARVVFWLIALASAVHTSYYKYLYLRLSYVTFLSHYLPARHTTTVQRLVLWLSRTPVLKEGWTAVSVHPRSWWWTEQVLLFAVAWAAFVRVESARRNVKYGWAYVLLGQLLSMSTGLALFFAALFSAPVESVAHPRPRLRLPGYLPLLGALLSIAYSPYLVASAALPNLLITCTLLLVPFLPLPLAHANKNTTTMSPSTLLSLLEPLAFVSHFLTARRLPKPFSYNALLLTLQAHPAHSAVGADVLWTAGALIAWSLLRRGGRITWGGTWEALGVGIGTIGVGIGVVGPVVCRGGVRLPRTRAGSHIAKTHDDVGL